MHRHGIPTIQLAADCIVIFTNAATSAYGAAIGMLMYKYKKEVILWQIY